MGFFRNLARVNDAAKSARIAKESELIESGKNYSEEKLQTLINNAGKSAKLNEKNQIRKEKDANKKQQPKNKTTNISLSKTNKVGVNDSNIQIANKGEIPSNKAKPNSKTKK